VTADGAYATRRCHTAIHCPAVHVYMQEGSTGRPPRSSPSARMGERGKRTAPPRSSDTKPCAPPGTTAGHSGSAGPDTMHEAGSRRTLSWFASKPLPGNGCGASKPSASASPQGNPTARPPKSRSASPSSTASTPSAQPRSFACPDVSGERGSHASGVSCATTPPQDPPEIRSNPKRDTPGIIVAITKLYEGRVTRSKCGSLMEAVTNTLMGYALAVATQFAVFPSDGLQVGVVENMDLGLIFTAVSLIHGYILRPLFDLLSL